MTSPQPTTRRTTRNASDQVNRIEARLRDASESYFELTTTHNADSDLRLLLARVRELEAALQPFAALANDMFTPEDFAKLRDDAVFCGRNVTVSYGDWGRAAAVLRGDDHE